MKKISRRLICITLVVMMVCSLMGNAVFATYDNPSIINGKTAYGASYSGSNMKADRLYKDYINPEYETKIVLSPYSDSDTDAVIAYAKTLGTVTPVEVNFSQTIIWNNGVAGCDAVGTKFYWAEPNYAITPVVNGTTTVTETVSDVHFSDVAKSDWFYDAVLWGVSYGVVYGTSDTTFSPNQTCTQSQILTLIHRQMGSPAATSTSSPFSNIKSSDWYYDAVLWAAENGVYTGSTFDPNAPCTRADTVLYLWRAKNSPAVNAGTKFTDVDASAEYAKAVAWAVSEGIIYGTSDTTFSPDQTCTRGQIVTILHRYAGSPAPKTSGTTTVNYKYAPDVPDTYEYAEAINYCIENRLFKLDADGKFHPERTFNYGEMMALITRIRGWRIADGDYNWDGHKPVQYDGHSERTAEYFGYKLTDAEPWWYKDIVTHGAGVWQFTPNSDFTPWAEKPMNNSAFLATLGGFCECFFAKSYELPIVCDLPVTLFPEREFPKILAEKGFNVTTLTKAANEAYVSGWYSPKTTYAFRYGFINAENSSTMADNITIAEVCQWLYNLGITYNDIRIHRYYESYEN